MRIALIADDLTGANNAGVGLVKRGFAVATTLRGVTPLPEGYDALCIDTGSRYVAADEARRRVTETARAARAHGAALVCKRIDTLLRGNLGAELDGGLAALGSDALAVVAPAFPDSGRVVDDGHLLVDGAPVDQHPVAAGDRLAPVRHSYVPHLLAEQSAERTVRIDRATVQGGAAAVAAALEGAARGGVRVAVVDAASNEEVQTIARALVSLERAVMPVDPGALSAAYAEACFTPAAHSARRVGRPRGRKVLAAVASTTALTRRQLDRLARDFALEPVRLEAQALIDVPASGEDVVDRAVATGLERLRAAEVAVLTTVPADGAVAELDALAADRGVAPQALATRIADGLARAAVQALAQDEAPVGGCYCTGGDALAALFAAAGARAINLLGEVGPLIAHGELVDGPLAGLELITKGGSVGEERTAGDCVRYLAERLAASPEGRA